MRNNAREFILAALAAASMLVWAPVASAMTATGGSTNDILPYRIHTFTNSGTFTVASPGTVEVLIAAGGGGGGRLGGGGGAGGLIYSNAFPVDSGSYTVTSRCGRRRIDQSKRQGRQRGQL